LGINISKTPAREAQDTTSNLGTKWAML